MGSTVRKGLKEKKKLAKFVYDIVQIDRARGTDPQRNVSCREGCNTAIGSAGGNLYAIITITHTIFKDTATLFNLCSLAVSLTYVRRHGEEK